jgi:hypothetical protein
LLRKGFWIAWAFVFSEAFFFWVRERGLPDSIFTRAGAGFDFLEQAAHTHCRDIRTGQIQSTDYTDLR